MARIVKEHKIEKPGRDHGKVFVITEMAPRKAHAWALKAIFGILGGGVTLPDDLAAQGLAGLAKLGIQGLASIPHAVAAPLLDELMECVEISVQGGPRKLFEEDIEEMATIFDLQKVTLTMHLEPFIGGGNRNSALPPAPQTPAPQG